ncbi:MAG TPA: biotin carboxylase N-terminal domain-containing protein [Anaeromyxobacteraceae bacterium]|nr:biotin carboxylase N-terminal domain-containing protein [Anaeromyxobacteraceae bacterium]
MFRAILVANRGEIAVRVLRTLREMGIRGVAVYSDADRGAPHLAAADEAVPLGDPDPASSYLDGAKIIEAARRTGAEAIHPGYGFLSESPAFARAVRDAGLAFVGPPPEAMARVGNKIAARRLLKASGVPIVPGMVDPEPDPARLARAAEEIGWPVMLKAAAGGGGKGMRLVRRAEDLAEAARRGASEALAAFGDGSIYLEKALDRPRHVEFQVLADAHGRVVHCFERECSLQRRHQKILEETPSPALDPELRRRMGDAAVEVARRAGYVNAGTVEFLLTADGRFWFLEVNARLQVEHPITEVTTGLDLVRCQVEIAAGLPLPVRQEDLVPRGHAIECRIYAEDPAAGFSPSPGRIARLREPQGPGIRVDSGIAAGLEVPIWYDPILAKVVAHAGTRDAAIARMARALGEYLVEGVATPIPFLLDVLRCEPFRAGRTHTGFVEEHFAGWQPAERPGAASDPGPAIPAPPGAAPRSPWATLGAWDLTGNGSRPSPEAPRARVPAGPAPRRAASAAAAAGRPGLPPGAVTPPMPALVVAVLVEEGRAVARGEPLVVVSAMKTESQLVSPVAGRVRSVNTRVGARVRPGDILVQVEPEGGRHDG